MLDATSFLQVTLLKLIALFAFKTQIGVMQGSVYLLLNSRAICLFPFSHHFPFFRAHLHPTLGVPSKYLSIFRRHRDPSIARIVQLRSVAWRRHSATIRTLRSLRLRLCRSGADDQNRDRRYKVCVSSSHKLFSSVANNSSRSAT